MLNRAWLWKRGDEMPEDLNFSDFPTLPITVWKELLSVMSHLDSLQLNSVHVELPLALSEVNIGAMQEKRKQDF